MLSPTSPGIVSSTRRLCRVPPFVVAVVALLMVVSSLVASPPVAAQTDTDTVIAALATTPIYVEPDAIAGDGAVLQQAVVKASEIGVRLYVVVLGDGSTVRAREVQDALGDVTVLLFRPETYDFESADICRSRFNEAVANADGPITSSNPDVASLAFIDAVAAIPADTCADESETTEESGTAWWVWVLVALAVLALVFFLWTLLRVIGNSRRKESEAREFEDRRRTLREWAMTLRDPITELQQPVTAARSSSLAVMYNDALEIARETDRDLDQAQNLAELDRVEIRIARAHMQIRDVRVALDR